GEIATGVARDERAVEFAAVPELDAGLRGARDVRVGDDNAVGGPDHAGAIAAPSGADENGGTTKLLGDFTETVDGHVIRLRGGVRRRRCSLLALRRHGRT